MPSIFMIARPPGNEPERPRSFLSEMIKRQSSPENEEFKAHLMGLLQSMNDKLERLPTNPSTHVGGG